MSPADLPDPPLRWQDGWPSAQVRGVQLLRQLVLPPMGDEGPPDELRTFQLTAERSDSESHPPLVITADVALVHNKWFLSVAVMAGIAFQAGTEPPLESDDDLDAALKTYGPWTAHVLWDFARTALLSATAAIPTAPLEIDRLTPAPRLLTRPELREMQEADRSAP